jgi:hypothetical protein
MPDELTYIRAELGKRKGQWRNIAAALPGCSYSWLQKVASGNYPSSPAYGRVVALAKHLRATRNASRSGARAA